MAAVFPESIVKQENGNYIAYFVDANGNTTTREITRGELVSMYNFSYEHFGRAPNIEVIS